VGRAALVGGQGLPRQDVPDVLGVDNVPCVLLRRDQGAPLFRVSCGSSSYGIVERVCAHADSGATHSHATIPYAPSRTQPRGTAWRACWHPRNSVWGWNVSTRAIPPHSRCALVPPSVGRNPCAARCACLHARTASPRMQYQTASVESRTSLPPPLAPPRPHISRYQMFAGACYCRCARLSSLHVPYTTGIG